MMDQKALADTAKVSKSLADAARNSKSWWPRFSQRASRSKKVSCASFPLLYLTGIRAHTCTHTRESTCHFCSRVWTKTFLIKYCLSVAMFAIPTPKQKKPAVLVLAKPLKPTRQIPKKLLTKMPPLLLMSRCSYLEKCRSKKVWKLAFKLRQEMIRGKGLGWFTENNDVQTSDEEGLLQRLLRPQGPKAWHCNHFIGCPGHRKMNSLIKVPDMKPALGLQKTEAPDLEDLFGNFVQVYPFFRSNLTWDKVT